jgi:hypothetical protein
MFFWVALWASLESEPDGRVVALALVTKQLRIGAVR